MDRRTLFKSAALLAASSPLFALASPSIPKQVPFHKGGPIKISFSEDGENWTNMVDIKTISIHPGDSESLATFWDCDRSISGTVLWGRT